MYRRATLTLRWLFMWVLFTAAFLFAPHDSLAVRVGRAALLGAIYPTVSLLMLLSALRHRRPYRPGTGDERAARWRAYDGDGAGRWRSGWLHRSAAGVALVPVTGAAGPRLDPASVEVVGERDATFRESVGGLDPVRVVELTVDGRRLDLLVGAADVAAVRGWLASG